MSVLPSVVRSIIRRLAPGKYMTGIVGYVENLTPGEVSGWAIHTAQVPVELTLRVNDVMFPMNINWLERADISERYGRNHLASGFRFAISDAIRSAMEAAMERGNPVEVLANQVALRSIRIGHHPLEKTRQERLSEDLSAQGIEAELESWGSFSITGWAVNGKSPATSIDVRCNGNQIQCAVLRKDRHDVSASQEMLTTGVGFEIEIPGYIWEGTAREDVCEIEILVDGRNVTKTPLKLDRVRAAEWCSDVVDMSEGPEQQYRALLVLEHIRYADIGGDLGARDTKWLSNFARRMRLDAYAVGLQGANQHTNSRKHEGASTLLLWDALRELNRMANEGGYSPYACIKKVVRDLRLRGKVREQFFRSSVPLLCRSNEFSSLRELLDFGHLIQLENEEQPWKATLALPALVVEGHIERATSLCYRLPKILHAGWLNTECLRYGVSMVQAQSKEGEVDQALAERFRYAVITIIDALGGEWFSRLHDSELIESMLLMLADSSLYTDYHQRDVVEAALRNYGVNPTFWSRAEARGLTTLTPEMQRGYQQFECIRRGLFHGGAALQEQLESLEEALTYFRNRGNHEAVMLLRETCMNVLAHTDISGSSSGRSLIKQLLASDPAEAMRIAASPMPGADCPVTADPEAMEMLSRALRYESGRQASVVYELQCAGARALLAAKCPSNEAGLTEQDLSDLEQRAIAVVSARDQYLGVDLLAAAYALSRRTNAGSASVLMRLADLIRKAAAETTGGKWLPAPVMSALGLFMAMPQDAMLHGFCDEVVNDLRRHCAGRYERLLNSRDKPLVSMAARGWPGDTMVVIYSCRKNMESRIAAIRETWVQDLNARGIPYVILVGDGDDTLRGDMLELDVSDRYEDLPQKTLKLFGWVYRHTDAQYVVKIDDDCYLDVDRYFDTLSYRKHHYYGRVIWRDVGSMERDWHQPKSHSLRSRKCIDKSPEPSVYADGGGAYCLSRLAIERLLAETHSEKGARLIACSFMEDKLVGDLLALSNINPVDEDYESYQRRRTYSDAIPVGMWENTFYPGRLTPTKVVHLDTADEFAKVHQRRSRNEVWPKKLWPTCSQPSIKADGNQLELISDTVAVANLLQEMLVVVSVVRNEAVMLPHFLHHYRDLGVRCFIFIDNCSDDGTREYLCKQPDVVLFSSDTEYKKSHYGVAWQQAILGNLCIGKWTLMVDADELLVYDDCEHKPLSQYVAEIEGEGADAVATYLIDMYPYGDLAEADLAVLTPFEAAPWFEVAPLVQWWLGSGMYSNGATFLSTLRHRLSYPSEPNAFTSQKTTLVRYQPWMRFSHGLHDASNVRLAKRPAWIAHFKYHSGFKDKVHSEVRRGQHYNEAAEYRRYLVMLAEGGGGFGDTVYSQRYQDSRSFSAIESYVVGGCRHDYK